MDSTVPRQEVCTQAHADIWQETQVVNVYKVDRQDRDKERVSKSMYVHYFIEVLSKSHNQG